MSNCQKILTYPTYPKKKTLKPGYHLTSIRMQSLKPGRFQENIILIKKLASYYLAVNQDEHLLRLLSFYVNLVKLFESEVEQWRREASAEPAPHFKLLQRTWQRCNKLESELQRQLW